MELFKIDTWYVVAETIEQAKEAVKDRLPSSYFSESVCPVHVIAAQQSVQADFACTCGKCEPLEGNEEFCKFTRRPIPQSR